MLFVSEGIGNVLYFLEYLIVQASAGEGRVLGAGACVSTEVPEHTRPPHEYPLGRVSRAVPLVLNSLFSNVGLDLVEEGPGRLLRLPIVHPLPPRLSLVPLVSEVPLRFLYLLLAPLSLRLCLIGRWCQV